MYSGSQNMVFATVNAFHVANQIFDNTLNTLHSMDFATEKDDNESYTFKQMLQQEDRADFIKVVLKETNDLKINEHWEVDRISEKPANIKTILAIWAFKRKRYPGGRIWKHKARLCAHGAACRLLESVIWRRMPLLSIGLHSIRFLLVVAQALQLTTQAIALTLAFPQADLEVPIYMELPST